MEIYPVAFDKSYYLTDNNKAEQFLLNSIKLHHIVHSQIFVPKYA